MPAAFSMMMLTTTPEGDAYTFREIERMAKDAGFSRVEMVEALLGLDRMMVAYQ